MSATAEVEVEVVRSTGNAETSIVSWLFEKVAGAAVGSAAGFGLDYVMALVGIKDPPDAVKNRLIDIQKGIDAILTGVAQIRGQLDQLVSLLSLKTDEIKTAIQESVINPAIAVIEAHYGTGASLRGGVGPTPIVSLSDGVRTRIAAPSQEIDVKTFSDNVVGAWDIHGQIVKIASTAATKTQFTQKPLLEGWSDYLLEKNKGHVLDRALTIYLTLESYFQQLLAAQFKGIALVSSAKCYDKTEAAAKPIAEAYLAEVAKLLTPQADLFVQCADEIIVAIFTETQWLFSPGPTKAEGFIRTISRRANLIRAIVYASVGKASAINGGICGTVIGRNVDKEVAASRTFTPSGYAASEGTVFGPLEAGGNVPIEWEASADNKYGTLRDKSTSAFQAFHYYWPFPKPLPEVGKPIDSSFDGGLTPQWYDLNTLEKVDKPNPEHPNLLVADFCEMRFMRGAIFAKPADADAAPVSTPADKGTTNNNENRVGYRNDEVRGIHAMRADETFQRLLTRGSLEVHMNYHEPQGGQVGFTLEFPLFRYKGNGHTLHFASELEMKLELVRDVLPQTDEDHSSMLMSPRGKFWLVRDDGAKTEIPLYNTNDRGLSLWGQGSPVQLENNHPFAADVTLDNTGDKEALYSLVLELCVINTLYSGPFDPVDGRHAVGRITYGLRGFRMMWK